MQHTMRRAACLTAVGLWRLGGTPAAAQQFNSDNYLSKPAGVATVIVTFGQRNDIFMTTFSLIPRWEFTAAAYIVNTDNDPTTDDGYSTSYYFKYMLFENKAKTGGFAVKAGTGLDPGYLAETGVKDAFRTYWMNVPVTLPFFNNAVSWDLMPGVSYSRETSDDDSSKWSFTYSTRVAWYPFSPKLAVVGEVFGAEGQLTSIPEYKTGLRWEPNQYATFAATYGQEFSGENGARFELGMMLFTPPFFCITGCHAPSATP
jgi:hypothetical protein